MMHNLTSIRKEKIIKMKACLVVRGRGHISCVFSGMEALPCGEWKTVQLRI